MATNTFKYLLFVYMNTVYTFEVGGASKNFQQIAGSKDSYLALDEMPLGIKNKIPLWLFGFLY
jgi:uncharacterized protein